MLDFHLHSNRSDGELSPLDLARHALTSGLTGFSITDHNYISPEYPQIADLANSFDAFYVPGVEISTRHRKTGASLHILGYGQQMNIEKLNKYLEPVRDGYNKRAINIIRKLNQEYPGLELDFGRELERSGSSYVSRNWLALEFKKRTGDTRSIKEIMPTIFAPDQADFMPDTTEAINTILACGGYPVLAHPGRIPKADLKTAGQIIKDLKPTGLAGIEAYYVSHDVEQVSFFLELAENLDMKISGGSDWHGPKFTPTKKLGCPLGINQLDKLPPELKPATNPNQ